MPYAFVQDIEGGDWDTYQAITEEAGDERPEGLVVHVAGPTDTGVRLIDVWESEEACQRFLSERLLPARAKVLADRGFEPMTPRIDVLDVQHVWR
jgi:hypothetical protein